MNCKSEQHNPKVWRDKEGYLRRSGPVQILPSHDTYWPWPEQTHLLLNLSFIFCDTCLIRAVYRSLSGEHGQLNTGYTTEENAPPPSQQPLTAQTHFYLKGKLQFVEILNVNGNFTMVCQEYTYTGRKYACFPSCDCKSGESCSITLDRNA